MHKKKERKRKGRSKREQYWVRKTKVEKMNKRVKGKKESVAANHTYVHTTTTIHLGI